MISPSDVSGLTPCHPLTQPYLSSAVYPNRRGSRVRTNHSFSKTCGVNRRSVKGISQYLLAIARDPCLRIPWCSSISTRRPRLHLYLPPIRYPGGTTEQFDLGVSGIPNHILYFLLTCLPDQHHDSGRLSSKIGEILQIAYMFPRDPIPDIGGSKYLGFNAVTLNSLLISSS